MYIDKHLNWNFHVNELCKKLGRANGIISKLRYNAPIEICLQVYYAIFYSYLINGCNLWGLTPRNENINRIERLQKKCLRIMSFSPFNSHTNQIFQDLKLLKVRDVIKYHQLKLVRDFYEKSLPNELLPIFQLSKDIHTTSQTLNSAYNNLLFIPSFKSMTYGKKSIRYSCPKLWNETFKTGTIQIGADRKKDIKLSSIETANNFKNTLKKHFLYKYSLE